MSNFPDIQKGQSSILKYVLISAGVFGLFIGVALIANESSKDNAEKGRRTFIKSSGLPEGFFYSDKEAEIKQPEAVDVVEPVKTKPRKKEAKRVYTKKVLSAKEAFLITKQKREASELDRRRREFNNKRLRGALTLVARGGEDQKQKFTKSNSEKDWSSYGIEKDIASLPVNLTRTITADRMIPCLLVNEILTDLGGKIVCKVEENIYGAHGRKVLIDAGSSAIGRFSPLKKVGDERVRVLWNRIISPQGINIITTNAELTDTMGRSGATAEVDRRYTEKYGLALLFSTVSNLAAYQVPVQSVNQQIIVSNYTKDLSSTTNKILDEQINIKPRGRVAAGSRIFINPVRDIWFSKPRNNTVTVSFSE